MVKVINIDPTGKIRLSRKALLRGRRPEVRAGSARRNANKQSQERQKRSQETKRSGSRRTFSFWIEERFRRSVATLSSLPRERFGRGEALADGWMAVEEPLHNARRILFGEILRAEAFHRRRERDRDCGSVPARSDRRDARSAATTRARLAPVPSTRRPSQSAGSACRSHRRDRATRSAPTTADNARAATNAPTSTNPLSKISPRQMSPWTWCASSCASTTSISSSEYSASIVSETRIRRVRPVRQRRVGLTGLVRQPPLECTEHASTGALRQPQQSRLECFALQWRDAEEQRHQQHRTEVRESDDAEGEDDAGREPPRVS